MKNYGFIEPEIKDTDYRLCGYTKLSAEVLCPDGQWDDYLPEKEYQNKNGLETSSCVTFGTLNCLEILYKKLYGKEENYSERYIAKLSGTTPSGNSIQTVADTIRKKGNISEKLLPFSSDINTWDKFFTNIPEELLLMGQNWLTLFSYGHEYIFTINNTDKQAKLKEALKYSPCGVSVCAWIKDDNGRYIKPAGTRDNHWVCCYGHSCEGPQSSWYWKIYDTYDDTHKKLVWDYDFGYAKRYVLQKKSISPAEKLSFYQRTLRVLAIISEKLKTLKGRLGKAIKNYLGQILK